MNKIIIKGIFLFGRYRRYADDYYENYDPYAPTDYDSQSTYNTIENFLSENGSVLVPQTAKILPFFDEGFITPSATLSIYRFNDVLVANRFMPHGEGLAHIIHAAAILEKSSLIQYLCSQLLRKINPGEAKIDETFDLLKDVVGFKWKRYWKPHRDIQTREIPDSVKLIGILLTLFILRIFTPSGMLLKSSILLTTNSLGEE